MCRWLEDVFLKVHPQLLITVLIKGTHTSERSSVTLVICNLSTGSISKRKLGLRWGVILFTVPVLMDTIWTNQIGYIHLLSAQNWKPRLKRLCTVTSRVSRPSFFFSCSFNLLHCYSKKEGRSHGWKENFTCCPYNLSYGHLISWSNENERLYGKASYHILVGYLTFLWCSPPPCKQAIPGWC